MRTYFINKTKMKHKNKQANKQMHKNKQTNKQQKQIQIKKHAK